MSFNKKNKQIKLKQKSKISSKKPDSSNQPAEVFKHKLDSPYKKLTDQNSPQKTNLNQKNREPLSFKKAPLADSASSQLESKDSLVEKTATEKELLINRVKKAESDFIYLRAEFDNYKRRALEERYRLLRYSGEKFISELAEEVLDDLDRAFFVSHEQKSVEDLQKGLKMIHKKLEKLFQKFGIEVLDPKGESFDPSYQEALNYVESSDLPEDQIVETYKKAYKLHDKIIRPAQVSVSRKKKDSD